MIRGERLNGYTHLTGAVLAAGGCAQLVSLAATRNDPMRLVSFAIYGATLFLMYLSSTAYHSTRGRAKDVLRKVDYSAIYLLIAGSYTPFALVALRDTFGWNLFAAAWALAAVGIAQEIWVARGARLTSLAIYLVMGWMGLLVALPLVDAISLRGFLWLFASGLVYTVGIVFYLYDDRFPYWHGIWHLFVLAGSALHYFTVVKFVA
ncbi:MAG TPA: hemolysin III family protein [Usitatibacter sp.]|jgi:hemolysin III|nr:hemolysin III family protein [Usitatibacter sp.]